MQVNPDDFREFLAALRKLTPEEIGISERTYYQWLSGDLPGAFVILLHNPDFALEVFREAERRSLLKQLDEKKTA